MVFDRSGLMVYRSNGDYLEAPWNGTFNGQPLPSCTYYYIINLNAGTGASRLTGGISILR
jgi:gliding motility-associated-like protein